jgi:hypothetical protein
MGPATTPIREQANRSLLLLRRETLNRESNPLGRHNDGMHHCHPSPPSNTSTLAPPPVQVRQQALGMKLSFPLQRAKALGQATNPCSYSYPLDPAPRGPRILHIRDGKSTKIWECNWIPRATMLKPFCSKVPNPPTLVSELIGHTSMTWKMDVVLHYFNHFDSDAIL